MPNSLPLNLWQPTGLDRRVRLTKIRRMRSITVKLPAALEKRLRSAARKRRTSLSDLTRLALAREVESAVPDFAKLAAPYRGMYSGPADLSTRKGYGG